MKPAKAFVILMILFSLHANAQKLVFLFGHAEYASVVGDLKTTNDNGFGFEAGVGVGLKKTFITGTIGSTWLRSTTSNSIFNNTGSLHYLPFKVGLRRYILTKNLFVKADAGIASMKYKDAASSSSKFTFDAGAGLKFTSFEVIGDYTNVSGFGSWLSVKAGVVIGL